LPASGFCFLSLQETPPPKAKTAARKGANSGLASLRLIARGEASLARCEAQASGNALETKTSDDCWQRHKTGLRNIQLDGDKNQGI
jgi:hypothetical protein